MKRALLSKKRQFQLAIGLCVSLIIFALLGPFLAPHDPLETDFLHILAPPSALYPLGTDQVGRCILSRLLYGAQISLGMTFAMLSVIFVLGIAIGVVAGIRGGWLDTIIMRIADTILAFPDLVFAIAVVGLLGPGMVNTMCALAIIWWTKFARLSRVLVRTTVQSDAVIAGRMAGASGFTLVRHYILPSIMPPMLTQLSLDIGNMMLALAGLSFLGLGVQPPTPEWGNMLSEGREYLQSAPWLVIYPGIATFVVVIVFNILGDATRKYLNPERL
ncbi:ABC transporter permease [Ferrimonas lipolytica]|uniref:ABC transporter permease subunit n=1 Tax=Ferrimonas lipolytica TaxID=2724191 RepID=A0A6H1UBV4_9GAMM|nr:ABC transporter permease subunit [Ferrimonas lipolytica]QIZ76318.1 ABC transporter permease subunit [Ferrimonas lipolytica]